MCLHTHHTPSTHFPSTPPLPTLSTHPFNTRYQHFRSTYPPTHPLTRLPPPSQILMWDVAAGAVIRRLHGHSDVVTGLAVSGDSSFIVSSSLDFTLKVGLGNPHPSFLPSSFIRAYLLTHLLIYPLTYPLICPLIYHLTCSLTYAPCNIPSHTLSRLLSTKLLHPRPSPSPLFLPQTWFLTPRPPDPPDAPMLVTKNDITVMIKWTPPPAFNLEISAYHLQFRVGLRGKWHPLDKPGNHPTSPDRFQHTTTTHLTLVSLSPPLVTMPPWFRTKLVTGLEPLTQYQFRLMAENEMGKSAWGEPSKVTLALPSLPPSH